MGEEKIQLFRGNRVRSIWDNLREEWYFSVVDVIGVLTEQTTQRGASDYWAKLKQRLKEEGANELLTNCQQLKMISPKDGKRYKTDAMTTGQILRLVQSVPSKKAEPFKLWLAKVGKERIDETIDPELAMDRAMDTYLKKGVEYAILTDEISVAWSGMTTKEYKNYKGLKKENLRDNMSDMELVLTMLSEATTAEIEKQRDPKSFDGHKEVARSGGEVAGVARKEVEARTGQEVITSKNAEKLNPMKDLLERVVEGDSGEEG